ncbi:hypothetical protein [Flavobacterium oreochromis]
MKLGALAFALFKSKQQKQVSYDVDEYVVYTLSTELCEKVSNSFQKRVLN